MFGIGKALKRGAKSLGRKFKKNPFTTMILPLNSPNIQKDQIEKGVETGVGVVTDVIVPKVPELPEQVTAPIPDDEERKRAKERAAQRKYASSGRAGTMLTNSNGTLG